MDRQDLITLLVGFIAAVPGLVALYYGYRRTTREQSDGREARAEGRAQDSLLAQLQEQITKQQKTIRFLSDRVDELETARKQEYAETESLREETEGLRQEVRELRRGVQALIGQIESVPLTPVWRPPERAAAAPATGKWRAKDVTALRDKIAEQFIVEEINDLAFRLGTDPEDLTGETSPTRALSLVRHFKNLNRMEELRSLCAALRPNGGF